ncbi:uncharacterized protein LOC121993645 [Zingiber officinale]|uniref:C2 domain-containing protein n=1 Tax=Zingiber officinale TaxID=94328 RepID=A0A8J5L2M0_ZINOF|nr:uncharacterized protein LOC121993645 [Zingiber officinale]KAG6498520.1 hypothetical protein ZIOFF_038240 [Zingiber officinale]
MGIDESTDRLSNLKLEIRVDRLSNFNLDLSRDGAFVRYYVVAGKGQRIRVDTREVFPSLDQVWDEVATMECRGRVGEVLQPHVVVFELWRRRPRTTRTLFFSRSRLLGRAEVAWKEVLAAPEMTLRRCVGLGSLSSEWSSGVKSPGLLVEMKVEVNCAAASVEKQRIGRERCGCRDSGGFGNEEEMLLAAATLNAW